MLDQIVFVGFNSKVAALDRTSGRVLWHWRSPRSWGYTTVMLDGDRLIVSVMGYTYCLDPLTGQQSWVNELPGMGMGVASLASVRGMAGNAEGAAEVEEETNNAAAAPMQPPLDCMVTLCSRLGIAHALAEPRFPAGTRA